MQASSPSQFSNEDRDIHNGGSPILQHSGDGATTSDAALPSTFFGSSVALRDNTPRSAPQILRLDRPANFAQGGALGFTSAARRPPPSTFFDGASGVTRPTPNANPVGITTAASSFNGAAHVASSAPDVATSGRFIGTNGNMILGLSALDASKMLTSGGHGTSLAQASNAPHEAPPIAVQQQNLSSVR